MSEYYFSANIDHDTVLCIAPLTSKRIELSGQQIEDDSGYFLFKTKGDGEPAEVEILARLSSDEAALRLRAMLNME